MDKQELLKIEVKLDDPSRFLMIAETLTRIGIPRITFGQKELFQSCHILFKQDLYFIVHFKELLHLDGAEVLFTKEDIARRNTIASMLESWGLLTIATPHFDKEPQLHRSKIKVVRTIDKDDWTLTPKYKIGLCSRRKQM